MTSIDAAASAVSRTIIYPSISFRLAADSRLSMPISASRSRGISARLSMAFYAFVGERNVTGLHG